MSVTYRLSLAIVCSLGTLPASLRAEKPKRTPPQPLIEIPLRSGLEPKPEVPVFAVASSGLRVLISTDDGRTWKQSLLVSDEAGDGAHRSGEKHVMVPTSCCFRTCRQGEEIAFPEYEYESMTRQENVNGG